MTEIGKHYKRERASWGGVEIIKPVAEREFIGQTWLIVEKVFGDRATVDTIIWSDTWEDATPVEWATAVKLAAKAKAKANAHEAWLVDAKRFGVPVQAVAIETVIVRVTKTLLFDLNGWKWDRKNGISREDLNKIETTVSRREKVDIVADRKMIAEGLDEMGGES